MQPREPELSDRRISIDDLLANQASPAPFWATIEGDPNDPTSVKITPFVPGAGCACGYAITIPKDAVESIDTTDDVHVCCGQTLVVVEVAFVDATVGSIFRQLSDLAAGRGGQRTDPAANAAQATLISQRGPMAFPSPYADPKILSDDRLMHPRQYPYADMAQWIRLRCNSFYHDCIDGCTDPRCQCICYEAYQACLDPNYHPRPCDGWPDPPVSASGRRSWSPR